MGLIDLGVAFVAAVIADLRGDETTRPFTRKGFLALVLLEAGLSLAGLESTLSAVIGLLGGFL